MTWLTWLMLAAIIVGVAAVTGLKPKGTRHVARTNLMGVARTALVVVGAIIALVVLWNIATR